MAYLTTPKPDRRDFLKTAGLSLGALLTGGCAHLKMEGGTPAEPAHWALLSDTHVSLDPKEVYRDFIINNNMKTAVAQVSAAGVDGAMITGDCARLTGRLYDYDMLWRILKPLRDETPVAFALGNHDERTQFQRVFHRHPADPAPIEGKFALVIDDDAAGVRLVLLDSLEKTNATPGRLGDAQRAWLTAFLDEVDPRPTFLFFHHPPTEGNGNLLDHKDLFEIVMPRRQVKALFYGHSHVYRYSKVEDLDLINLPAIGYNFNDKIPVGWVDARIGSTTGEFTLKAFAGNTADNGKTTTLEWRA